MSFLIGFQVLLGACEVLKCPAVIVDWSVSPFNLSTFTLGFQQLGYIVGKMVFFIFILLKFSLSILNP